MKPLYLVFLLLVLNFSSLQAISFFGNPRSDTDLGDFLNSYNETLKLDSKVAKAQSEVFKEAYFLLLDNYIYELDSVAKKNLIAKAQAKLNEISTKEQFNLAKTANDYTIKAPEVMELIMDATFNDIDAHTAWISPKKSLELQDYLEGKLYGIGIMFEFNNKERTILVKKIFTGSPAYKSGLLKDDIIESVDGKLFTTDLTLENIVESIRGLSGTVVKLGITRQKEKFEVSVVRGQYYVPSVEYKILDNEYGYIIINSFNNDTASLFRNSLASLQTTKLKGLIIDVRNNPGGLLTAVVLVSDSILSGEQIVSIKGRVVENNRSFVSMSKVQINSDVPIVVLINSLSASAAELLAGTLAINNRAILMGDYSFGKWSVQSSYKLKNNSLFNITTQLFYAPKNMTFQGNGIAPDIQIIEANKNTFREISYSNALVVKNSIAREPTIKIQENKCGTKNNSLEDSTVDCALIYLKSANKSVFLSNISP